MAEPNISSDKDISLPRHISTFMCLIVLATAFSLVLSSCFEETFTSDVDIEFETSVDTLTFDTVFTTIGSATRSIVVRNPTSENINISSIALENRGESMFRLNVDGTPGSIATEVPILAGDSLFLFLEVTVDPDQPVSISPFVIEEHLIIKSGTSEKRVLLEAWGQNANYFPNRETGGQLVGLGCNGGEIVWDDPKPYVIYGLLFIDSCHLVIPAGTQVFVHGGIARQDEIIFTDGGLFFLEEGRLTTEGTADQPVVIQGDRLEGVFDDVSGQWSGIRFLSGSKGHQLNHTHIKNSTVGIRADSASAAQLSNLIISNTSNIGIIGVQADLEVDNTLIHSNGPQSVAMLYGGNYRYRHCTVANYGNQSAAVYMDNFTCVNAECNLINTHPLHVEFINSIIMGSNQDEIDVNDISEGADPDLFSLVLDHTLVKVLDEKEQYSADACLNCIEHTDQEVFLDETEDLYSLDTMSIAIGQGRYLMDLPFDILGVARDQESPDLGCFEFQD